MDFDDPVRLDDHVGEFPDGEAGPSPSDIFGLEEFQVHFGLSQSMCRALPAGLRSLSCWQDVPELRKKSGFGLHGPHARHAGRASALACPE